MRLAATSMVVLSLGLGSFTGCAQSASGGWQKPGVTEQELGRDTLECRNEASTMAPGRDGPRNVVNQDRYRRCMADRGYTSAPGK